MNATETKRTVFLVTPHPERGDWRVTKDDMACGRAPTKAAAVAFGRVCARSDWKNCGKPTLLIVCGQDGEKQTEYRYGALGET